ncbi:MAG: efflux RND transporter periplasmic adaptor subunit [Pyrinomonadaceae bacterium]
MSEKTEEKTITSKGRSTDNSNGHSISAPPDGDNFGERAKTQEVSDETAKQENEPKAETASEPKADAAPKKKKSKLPFIIGGAILLVAAIVGFLYWLHARQYESTDDAFIDGDIVQISPKISAYVTKVYVKSNQQVHKGDLLLELNAQDYEAKLEQAKAQLRAAEAQKNQSQAQVALTRATTNASHTQAQSGVEAARNNVQQQRAAADAKKAQIRQAQNAVKTAQANLAQVKATAPQAQANLNLAQKEYNRRLALYNHGDVSKESLDQANNALQAAQSQLDAAEKQIIAAQSRVGEAQANVTVTQNNYQQSLAQVQMTKSQVGESIGQLQDANAAPERIAASESQIGNAEAGVAQAEAAVHEAELELSYTKIYAPEDGFVTRKTVEEGQFVQPGAPLMAISLSDDVWVVANFKETQLTLMRVGQPVEIKVDAYPNQTFHGKVESFQAGTGSRFSVLPTENATGNYVKVVQRIPVKIVFDEQPDKVHLLAPGMSVEPEVKVR